jgi:hypothetical protein
MFKSVSLLLLLAQATMQSPPVEALGPAAWPNAPATVVDTLNAVGCHIPQPVGATGAMNLIHGHFAHSTQQDWAALCIDDAQHAHIEVVWSRDALCPSLPTMTVDLLHASITTAAPRRIREYETLYAGFPKSAPLATHDGIESSIDGAGSVVHFCVNGNWVERQGRPDSAP